MGQTFKQNIELPLCPYALQECNLGAAAPGINCPGRSIPKDDLAVWKKRVDALVGCKARGAELSYAAYHGHYKVVREKTDKGKKALNG